MHFTLAAVAALLPLAAMAMPTANQEVSARQAKGYTGDLTYYSTGLGSCGITSTDSDAIVALAVDMMQNGANPNDNPLCGQTITINYNGVETQATVVDTCVGCSMDDIDASPTLFSTVAPEGNGRVHGVNWWFNNGPDGQRPT